MRNNSKAISEFIAEHESKMLELGLKGQELRIFTEVQFFKELFEFAHEAGAVVRIDGKDRRGVALYERYWHAACAFLPEHIARTDLIHALLLTYIVAQGGDVLLTGAWSARRGNLFNRLVSEATLASDVVTALRSESWLDVETVQELITRGDLFSQ